jgi:hypothetical protein
MILTASLWVLAALLAVSGTLLLSGAPMVTSTLKRLPRSRTVAVASIILGGAGFLYHVATLGEADFGSYRWIIFGAAVFVGVMSFWHAPDFLAVRGLVILYLLGADVLLDAGFMRYEPSLLFCKGVVYLGIVLSMWLAVSPFRARDAIEWLTQSGRASRLRLCGGFLAVLGIAVAGVAVTL